MSEKTTSQILYEASRETTKRIAQIDKDAWPMPEGDVESYDDYFAGVVDERGINGIVEDQRATGRPVVAMDVMGYGTVLRDLDINAGLAIALSDNRTRYQRIVDEETPIDIIPGDVLQNATWRRAARKLKSLGYHHATLVMCRPIAGFQSFPHDLNLCYHVINQGWQLLDPQGGDIITELPQFISDELVNKWVEQINQTPGITAHYSSRDNFYSNVPDWTVKVLRLSRTSPAPEQLPPLAA